MSGATTAADVVRAVRRRVRVRGAGAVAAGLLTVGLAALAVAWLAAGTTVWRRPGAGPVLVSLAAGVGALVLALLGLRRWVWAVDDGRAAAFVEDALGLPAGRVRGVLELLGGVPAGTSAALHHRALQSLSTRMDGLTVADAAGPAGRQATVRLMRWAVSAGLLALAVLVMGLAVPERAEAGWGPLLRPLRQLQAPVLPALVVAPGDTAVARGADLMVRVRAVGRTTAMLRWRIAGDVPRQRHMALEADTARAVVGPVAAPLRYWLTTPDGAHSDTFQVRPLDPLFVASLSIDVTYPGYLGRPEEHYGDDAPPLALPAGTRLRIRGRATRRLGSAVLAGPDTLRLQTDGARFAAQWRPRHSGTYAWALQDDGGAPAGSVPGPLELAVEPDAVPAVDVVFPGADTIMPLSLRQAVTADARDDHGIAQAQLVSWRISALGGRDSAVTQTLPVQGGRERVLLNTRLDANDRGLLPGDTLRYYVRVTDNAPAAHVARSRTYALRLPAMAELRAQTMADARSIVREATGLAQDARQLETETRDLNRRSAGERATLERDRAGGTGAGRNGRLSFEAAQQARAVLQRQEELVARADSLRRQVESLRRAMDQAGLRDPELQRRLQELSNLYSELLTPELRKQMEALRRALQALDPDQVMRALQELASRQSEFRQQVERSLELFRRAAAEQAMSALAQEAREMATRQDALAAAVEELGLRSAVGAPADSLQPRLEARLAQQDALGRRAGDLATSLDSLGERLDLLREAGARDATSTASAGTRAAQGAMRHASRLMQSGKGGGGVSGRSAASGLSDVAALLDSARLAMAEGWRRETQRTVREATRDALAMARRQDAVRAAMGRAQARGGAGAGGLQDIQASEGAIRQGLEQLGRNLSAASQRSAMIDRKVGAALGQALLRLAATQAGLEEATSRRVMPVDRAAGAVDALNQLALALLRNGEQIASARAGTGLQQALEELARLAGQQASVNGQSGAIIPLGLAPDALARQLQELAQQQRDIASHLGDVAGRPGVDDAVPGRLDELAAEASRLADEMDAGRLTPEMRQRQERLFHRLLDAGRSMQQDEVSNERVAERPGEVAPARAGPLDPALLDTRLRFPPPDAASLRALPPAYRRLILQYFDRLNRPTTGERRPTLDDRGASTDDRGPTTDARRPTTVDRPPPIDDPQPTAGAGMRGGRA